MQVSSGGNRVPSEDEFACSIDRQQLRGEQASLGGELHAIARLVFGLYCRLTSAMFGRV